MSVRRATWVLFNAIFKNYGETDGMMVRRGVNLSASENLVHIEEIVIRHAVLAALKTRHSFHITHPFDRVKSVDLLDLVGRDFLNVALVTRATEVVNRVRSQISQKHRSLLHSQACWQLE